MNAEEVAGRAAACPVSKDFDPFGSAFQADPGGSLAEARANQPTFFSAVLGQYVVTRYEDIRAVFADSSSFSTRSAMEPIKPLPDKAKQRLVELGYRPLPTLLVSEEPEHMRRRRRLLEPFKPDHVREWDETIRTIFNGYISRFVERGHADLVGEFFYEAPAVVALRFMGVPEDEIAHAKQFSNGLVTFLFGQPDEAEQVAACELLVENQLYAKELIGRLMESRGDAGVLNYAIEQHLADPADLEVPHLEGVATSMLAAAHETTSNALANAALLLLRHRESWDALCSDPTRIPAAVEECLRLRPPMAVMQRLCVKDTAVGEVTIPAGAKVLLVMASGNEDEAVFEEPDTFNIDRANARRHLAFAIGSHACLGAPLARAEMRIALELLTQRLPHMVLVEEDELEYAGVAAVAGPLALRVEWDPSQNPAVEPTPPPAPHSRTSSS